MKYLRKQNKLSASICQCLAVMGGISALAPHSVNAQQKASEEQIVEEVFVTGTNIKRPGLGSATPFTSVSSVDIEISGNNLLADTLYSLPSTGVPSSSLTTSNFGVFSSGLSVVNLRNLGSVRSLVLVNGRRYVGGDTESPNVVDLNSIPAGFVDRIEVVTGGASALYGSEAVAGVVNIITKKSFDGVEIDVQAGRSGESDGEEKSISITGGSNFDGEKGSALFYLGYSDLSAIYSRDRKFSKNDEFLGDFQAFSGFPVQGGIVTNEGYRTIAEDGTWTKDFNSAEDGFNRADYRLLQIPLSRKDIASNIRYEVRDNLEMFVETSYTQTESFSNLEPTITGQFISVGGNDLTIPSTNPFIPQEVLETWTNAGEDVPDNLTFRKRFLELGPRFSEQTRDTTRVAVGFEGEFSGWVWDTYYQWGSTNRSQTSTGNFNSFFFQQALDVVEDANNPGNFVCANPLARALGCSPIDVFGVGSISQEAVNFVAVGAQDKGTITQQVAAAKISGELFSIGSNDPVAIATGLEHRKESLQTTVDALSASGLSSSNTSAPVRGSYDVSEAFVELDIPLLSQLPLADRLSVNSSYRYADYSTSGALSSWKLSSLWDINSAVRVRGSLSKSVRAPNVDELFNPGGETFEDYIDPCLKGGIGAEGNTAANCASLGIPADYDPGSLGGSVGGISSGNIELKEETADTKTIGVVFQPDVNFDFMFTIDYFDIEIKDAITAIDPQIKLDKCYASEDFPNDKFCNGITRGGADIDFLLTRLDFGLENIGVLETSGVDYELNLGFDNIFGGTLDIKTLITRTRDWVRVVNGQQVSDYNEPGFQRYKGTNRITYTLGDWSTSLSTQYIGNGVVDNAFTEEDWPDNQYLNTVIYNNFNLSYDKIDEKGYKIYFGVKNLEDKQPPYIPSPSSNSDTGTATSAGVYDVVGRFFYTGFTLKI